MIAVLQGWTDWQILGAVGFLLFCASIVAGLIMGMAFVFNHLARWVEDRYARRRAQSDVVERCNVYRLHPADVVPIRRDNDAA